MTIPKLNQMFNHISLTKTSGLLLLASLVSCVPHQQQIVDQIITAQKNNSTIIPPSVQGFEVDSLDDAYPN